LSITQPCIADFAENTVTSLSMGSSVKTPAADSFY